MHLKEINPEKTPELFYCSRIDGEQTIYDQVAEDTSNSHLDSCIRSLRKKVYGGDAEFKMYSDYIEIAYNGLTIARAELVANYMTISWQSVAFDFSSANITKVDNGTFRFVVIQGNNVFGLEWSFAYGFSTKQTFYLDLPGRDVRIQWRAEVFDAALAINRTDNKGLKYSIDDYEGEVIYTTPDHPTEGWSYHIWTFEPDGYTCDALDSRTPLERYNEQAGLVIDPYLEIDEETDYYDIICDAYVLRIYGSTSGFFDIRNIANSTSLATSSPNVNDGTQHFANYDILKTVEVLSNLETYKRVMITGNWDSDFGSGEAYLSGSDWFKYIFHIYSDRVTIELIMQTNDTISLTGVSDLFQIDSSLSNSTGLYEDGNSEVVSSSKFAARSGDYIVLITDEMSITMSAIHDDYTGTTTYAGFVNTDLELSITGGTLLEGTHTFVAELIIDSAERENVTPETAWATSTVYSAEDLVVESTIGYECITGHTSGTFATDLASGYWRQCHLYLVNDRLQQGIQYTNPSLLTFTTGTAKTSGTGHTSIGTDGLDSTGAYNVITAGTDGDEVDLDLGQIEHKTNIVIHDFPYTSGDGDVDYLLSYWKCDSDIIDKVSGTDSNTVTRSGATFEPGYRGDGVQVDAPGDYTYFECTEGNNINAAKGCITFWYKATGTPIAYSRFFGHDSTQDRFALMAAAPILSRIDFQYNGVAGLFIDAAIENIYDGDWHNIEVFWDSANNSRKLWIDGEEIDEITTSITTPVLTSGNLRIGSEETSTPNYECDGIIDEFRIFSERVINYGAYFTGNTAAQLTAGMYHKDITGYISCSEATSGYAEIPNDDSVTITISGATRVTGVKGDSDGAYSIIAEDDTVYFSHSFMGSSVDEFSLSFWYKTTGTPNAFCRFLKSNVSDDLFRLTRESTTAMSIRLGGTVVYPLNHTIAIYDGEWHHIKIQGRASDNFVELVIDGIFQDSENGDSWSAFDMSSGNLYLGNSDTDTTDFIGGVIDELYITNKFGTPQIDTFNGVPRDWPIVRND